MELSLLYVWLSAMATVLITASLSRRYRGRRPIQSNDIIVTGFTLWGIIELSQVFWQLLTSQDLRDILGSNGSVALSLGLIAGIYFALKEVIKLY